MPRSPATRGPSRLGVASGQEPGQWEPLASSGTALGHGRERRAAAPMRARAGGRESGGSMLGRTEAEALMIRLFVD
jgi:hypothetical protein